MIKFLLKVIILILFSLVEHNYSNALVSTSIVYEGTYIYDKYNVDKLYYEHKLHHPKLTEEMFYHILTMHDETGIDIYLICNLIQAESAFYPNIWGRNTNGSIDKGLMMLNNFYYDEFSKKYYEGQFFDPFNIKDNITIGCRILKSHLDELNDTYLALCAYNCGLYTVKKNRIPQVTYDYALKILSNIY